MSNEELEEQLINDWLMPDKNSDEFNTMIKIRDEEIKFRNNYFTPEKLLEIYEIIEKKMNKQIKRYKEMLEK